MLKSLDVDLETGIGLERVLINSMATPAERRAEQDRAAASQTAYGKIFSR